MVIKMIKILFSIILSLFLFQNVYSANGDGSGQPTQYEVTMKKVELCTDLACSSPFTLGEKSMAADIVPSEGGKDVGNYASTSGIPVGIVYTHLRVTLDRTFKITGSVTAGTGGDQKDCATDGGNNAGATQMTVGTDGGTPAEESMFLVDAGSYVNTSGKRAGDVGSSHLDISYATPSSAKSISVSGDNALLVYELTAPYQKTLRAPVIKIAFDTSEAISANSTGCAMWIEEPSVSITLQ